MSKLLEGRTALVTGSTSGIGHAIALAFAREGARVMLNGFGSPGEIAAARESVTALTGTETPYSAADLSKAEEVRQMCADATAALGQVDILVNNAGIQFVSSVEEFPDAKWDAILAINLSSNFHAIKALLPGMRERNWGRIINVASAHGLVASPFKAAYVTAKHGVSEEAALTDFLLEKQPSKRWVEVEEVAAMALYLCGPNSGAVNGAALSIDGAWTAS